jgi:hypothetical protein
MISFAAELLKAGESYRAATEYLRVLHFYGGDAGPRSRALTGLTDAYAAAGRWEDAVGVARALSESAPSPEARLRLGTVLYRAGRFAESAQVLQNPESGAGGERAAQLPLLKLGAPVVDVELATQWQRRPQKSAWAAGLLSAVVPGAGQVYVDRPRDGAVAFVLNTLFAWGAIEAGRRRNWALCGVLGGVEAVWYAGTITGAVNGALEWNEREDRRFFERHEADRLPTFGAWIAPGGGGGIALTVPFLDGR